MLDLLCAATLTFVGATKLISPAADVNGVLPSGLAWVMAVVEILIAGVFVIGQMQLFATYAMVGLGCAFSVVQLMAISGKESCGCLGTVVTSHLGTSIVAGWMLMLGGIRMTTLSPATGTPSGPVDRQ